MSQVKGYLSNLVNTEQATALLSRVSSPSSSASPGRSARPYPPGGPSACNGYPTTWSNLGSRVRNPRYLIVAATLVLVATVHHQASSPDSLYTTTWANDPSWRPTWWPDESAIPDERQWGKTIEQGFQLDPSLEDLGEMAEQSYNLGFEQGPEGTSWYINQLAAFTTQFAPGLRDPLQKSLEAHFPAQLGRLDLTSAFSRRVSFINQIGPMIDYKNIFFTDVKVRQQVMDAWNNQNRGDGWDAWFMDDFQSARWIEKHFNNTEIHWASKWFPRPVLNADLLRYLVTLVEGGVYVDVDVQPRKPIMQWGTVEPEYLDISATDGPNWRQSLLERPSIIIGLESDAHDRWWENRYPRPLGSCQWAVTSAPYHPIMLDSVRRVVNNTKFVAQWESDRQRLIEVAELEGNTTEVERLKAQNERDIMPILDWTGPGMYGDAVLAFLLARYNVTWHRLRHRTRPLRIGDVMILPVTAFSPGTHFGAKLENDPQCALRHYFRGSWRGEGEH